MWLVKCWYWSPGMSLRSELWLLSSRTPSFGLLNLRRNPPRSWNDAFKMCRSAMDVTFRIVMDAWAIIGPNEMWWLEGLQPTYITYALAWSINVSETCRVMTTLFSQDISGKYLLLTRWNVYGKTISSKWLYSINWFVEEENHKLKNHAGVLQNCIILVRPCSAPRVIYSWTHVKDKTIMLRVELNYHKRREGRVFQRGKLLVNIYVQLLKIDEQWCKSWHTVTRILSRVDKEQSGFS